MLTHRFIVLTTFLFSYIFPSLTLAQFYHAGDCGEIVNTIHITDPTEIEFFTIPRFPSSLGLLKAYRTSWSGACTYTGGIENIIPHSSQDVTAYADCSYDVLWGDVLNLASQGSSIGNSNTGASFSLGPYDGTVDYGGTSGATTTLAVPMNEYNSPVLFSGSSAYYVDYGGSSPLQVASYPPSFNANSYLSWLGGGGNTTTTTDINVYASFSYIYADGNTSAADCDGDGTSNSCEIIFYEEPDTNNDGIPDTCPPPSPDCDNNGIPDLDEITAGAPDCNANGIPDSCEAPDVCGPLFDCDDDGISDADAIAAGDLDCNANAIPDSCEITAVPGLDTDPEFGNDSILDECQGRVAWENLNRGIQNAEIQPYWISGSEASPTFNLIQVSHTTQSGPDGKYIVPQEFFSYPAQSGELGRGIKASIAYIDDTGIQTVRVIANYPGWDPLKPLRSGIFDRKIYFPTPVVFQAGVLGEVNSGAVDTLRPFLTLDAGTNGIQASIKRGRLGSNGITYSRQPIPAFLFFAIPSGGPGSVPFSNDGVDWGYNNNPLASAQAVTTNANRFEAFIAQKVKPHLDALTEGNDSFDLPLNIAAHSYGGVITRKWMTQDNYYPKVNKYISFDAVHGGTTLASLYLGSWFKESVMNGVALWSNEAPTSRGWNYSHIVGTKPSSLFISNAEKSFGSISIISPYTSAFGIGRTISSFGLPLPNGHCGRFIGGWELPVFVDTHSVQNKLPVVVSASRFLSYGGKPCIGNDVDPGGCFEQGEFSASTDDSRYASVGCNVMTSTSDPNGTLALELNLTSSGDTEEFFPFDTGTVLHVDAFVSDLVATVDVYDGSLPLPKTNESITPIGSSGYLTSFDVSTTTGVKSLRLSSVTPASTSVQLTFPNQRFLLGDSDSSFYQIGDTVNLLSRMRTAGLTINPTTAGVRAKITHPDESITTLELFSDGMHGDGSADNGTFGNFFSATSQPGFYTVHFDADYDWSGLLIRRSAEYSFEVKSHAATFLANTSQYGHDPDGNGKLNNWAIELPVNVTAPGDYRISGELVGPNGSVTYLSRNFTSQSIGMINEPLLIPFETLYGLDPSATFTLSTILLSEQKQGQVLDEHTDIPLLLPLQTDLEDFPQPIIDHLLPDFGPSIGDYTAVLKGQHLASTTAVAIGGKEALFEVLSDNSLLVTIPTRSKRGRNQAYSLLHHSQQTRVNLPRDIKLTTAGGISILEDGFTYITK